MTEYHIVRMDRMKKIVPIKHQQVLIHLHSIFVFCKSNFNLAIRDSCSIPTNTYTCAGDDNFICISKDRICDGYADCPMHDDESDCTTICSSSSICNINDNVQCIQHPTLEQICRCKQSGYRLTSSTQQCQGN